MEYGTGAIMAVPAHDERDREFAEDYGLPIVPVIDDDGKLINSAQFDGLPGASRRSARSSSWLGEHGKGKPAINYRLRDWSFSRQRYWGCPIPIIYCDERGVVPVPEDELPVLLPEVEDYRPKGEPPLASNDGVDQRARARTAASRRGARPTRWTRSSTRPGTSCATATRSNDHAPFDRGSPTTGCRSTSTSAASTTRRGTCSTRASSSRR